jgi:hypothetical protein
MFLPCYYGSQIEDGTNHFLENIFESNWHGTHDDDKRKKNFLIVRENLKKSKPIKGAKIYRLNLETFLKVKCETYGVGNFSILNTFRF